jgi:hypothetical protein
MTTPSSPNSISMSGVAAEINSGANSGTSHYKFSDSDVRELAGLPTGFVNMGALRNKTWKSGAGTSTFYTSGTFNPPRGYSSVTVSWPTPSGLGSASYGVSYGTPVSVTIGAIGSGSSFGTQAAPAFDTTVYSCYGNVDGAFVRRMGIFTATRLSGNFDGVFPSYDEYDGDGNYTGHYTGAAEYFGNLGIYYAVTNESSHGNLGHNHSIYTIPYSCVNSNGDYEVYRSYFSGRDQGNSGFGFLDKNAGILQVYEGDAFNGEGFYNTVIRFRQKVFVTASWS